VGGRRVDRLALPGRRPVAQAVVRRAQVRAALDHAARDVRPGLARHQAGGRVGDPRVARHTASVPRSLSVPLGGEVVARPLPDVAGHVEQAVPVGREAADGGRAALVRRLEVLPGELTLPGVRHHLPPRERVVAPGENRAVGVGVLGGHVGDRVPVEAAHRAARPAWMAPVRARRVPPPLRHVPQVHRPAGGEEHQRSRLQQGRVRAGVLRRVERTFRDGRVPGPGHEPPELRDRDRVIVHPEAVDLDAARRAFLRVEVLRSHQELAARHPRHVLQPGATHGPSWRLPRARGPRTACR